MQNKKYKKYKMIKNGKNQQKINLKKFINYNKLIIKVNIII